MRLPVLRPSPAAFVALFVLPIPALFALGVWRGQYTVDVWYAGVASGVIAMWLLTEGPATVAEAWHAAKYVAAAIAAYAVGAGILYLIVSAVR